MAYSDAKAIEPLGSGPVKSPIQMFMFCTLALTAQIVSGAFLIIVPSLASFCAPPDSIDWSAPLSSSTGTCPGALWVLHTEAD